MNVFSNPLLSVLLIFSNFLSYYAFGSGIYSCVNESEVVYNQFNKVSYTDTFLNCLSNVKDPLLYPGYSTGEVVNVSTQIVVNNLILIDELQNLVSLDLFVLFRWFDPRLSMVPVWEANPSITNVDISQMITLQNLATNIQPLMWMPDIVFPDVQSSSVTNSYLKLYPGGELRWMRHITFQFVQNSFDYHSYPDDSLNIKISFFSFVLTKEQLQLVDFSGIPFENIQQQPALVFALNSDGQQVFAFNPIWKLKDASMSFTYTRLSAYNSVRSTGTIKITVQRRAAGVVFRLVLPIFLLLLVGAVQFWALPENRISTTLTLLLAVSALYLVLFSNIPMIGYLTKLDKFGLGVYIALFGCGMIHQAMEAFLSKPSKQVQWPLRIIFSVLLESLCRLVIVPLACMCFLVLFGDGFGEVPSIWLIAGATTFAVVVMTKQVPHMIHGVKKGVSLLYVKLKNVSRDQWEAMDKFTVQELVLMNAACEKVEEQVATVDDTHSIGRDNLELSSEAKRTVSAMEWVPVSLLELAFFNWFRYGVFSVRTKYLLSEKTASRDGSLLNNDNHRSSGEEPDNTVFQDVFQTTRENI